MADETVVQETTGQQEAASAEAPRSVQDMVDARMAEADSGEKTDEATGDKKPKPKQTTRERISIYADRAKASEERATQAEQSLSEARNEIKAITERYDAEIASIKAALSSGRITQSQADHAADTAKTAAGEALEEFELSEEMKPYQPEIAKLIQAEARKLIAPLLEKEQAREKAEAEKAEEEFRTENLKNYKAMRDEYPDLFESEPGEGGHYELKPEFNAIAAKIVEPFNEKQKDGSIYNPLLSSKDGLEMLFARLNREVDKATKAKLETENENLKVEKARKLTVENPQSRSAAPRTKSILEMTEARMKEAGL